VVVSRGVHVRSVLMLVPDLVFDLLLGSCGKIHFDSRSSMLLRCVTVIHSSLTIPVANWLPSCPLETMLLQVEYKCEKGKDITRSGTERHATSQLCPSMITTLAPSRAQKGKRYACRHMVAPRYSTVMNPMVPTCSIA